MTTAWVGRWEPNTSYAEKDIVYVAEQPGGPFYKREAWGISKPTFAEDRDRWRRWPEEDE